MSETTGSTDQLCPETEEIHDQPSDLVEKQGDVPLALATEERLSEPVKPTTQSPVISSESADHPQTEAQDTGASAEASEEPEEALHDASTTIDNPSTETAGEDHASDEKKVEEPEDVEAVEDQKVDDVDGGGTQEEEVNENQTVPEKEAEKPQPAGDVNEEAVEREGVDEHEHLDGEEGQDVGKKDTEEPKDSETAEGQRPDARDIPEVQPEEVIQEQVVAEKDEGKGENEDVTHVEKDAEQPEQVDVTNGDKVNEEESPKPQLDEKENKGAEKDAGKAQDVKVTEGKGDGETDEKKPQRAEESGEPRAAEKDVRKQQRMEVAGRKKESFNGKRTEKSASRSKSDPAQVTKPAGRFSRSKEGNPRGDSKGRQGQREQEQDRRDGSGEGPARGSDTKGGKKASEKSKEKPSEHGDESQAQTGGEAILSLLNKGPSKASSKSRSKRESKESKDAKGPSATELEAQWQKEELEKQKKLEEERKAEEEKRRKEEEQRLAEEEAERKKREEIKAIEDFIRDTSEKIDVKMALREQNLNAANTRPDDSFFGKLDSSLKKNTAFVKKLRNLTESQKDSLTKDFNGLNLTKYVAEVASGITDAKLKMSDIPCALHLSSLMHQRYADFSSTLLECWQKVLLSKKEDKITNLSKLRVDLRFFAELVSVGVFTEKEGLSLLANQLMILINNDKEEHNNLSIISSFCKHCGDDYAGLVPRKYRLLAEKYKMEIPRSKVLPEQRKKACRHLVKDYYQSLCTHLVKDHKELKNMERFNRKILQTKGELSQEKQEKYDAAQQAFQKLLQNTQTFADLLDEDVPEFPEEEVKPDAENVDIFNPQVGTEYQYEGDLTLFEDEDTRVFYENLSDLRAFIPGILYKDSEQNPDTEKEEAPDDDEELKVEDVEAEMEVEQQEEATPGEKSKVKDTEKEGEEEEQVMPPDIEDDDVDIASSMKLILEAYLQTLPNCVNRELIDKAAIDFCTNLNTKTNRKKLVKALFTVHRTRYDLLPFYSRLVATLHPCMPDVATDLIQLLKGDFKWHVRKKDQINIESKLKTVRFIGELVKFKIFPKTEALHCLKMLLFDFSHHNIEMACALLDTCGRFLYRSHESHHRTRVYLEVMMRKKTALHLDTRYTTMIENAFYYSNPPEVKREVQKERPPEHEYIRKLLYKDLSKVTTEKVLRQMRKLNWDDLETYSYIIKCLAAIWNVRYNCIHCAANLLAGVAPYHEGVAIQVVDGVLEDIRIGMEINHPKFNQRRVSCVKYLGELYNYRMVESAVIFKTLYSFISFGITLEESLPSALDPPEHLFRLRLVCILLDTCGQYFDRGSSKKKLDCFLVYLQRYYWFKKSHPVWSEGRPFPMDVEYMMQDTFEGVRPKMTMYNSKEEAYGAAEELDAEFRAKLAEVAPLHGLEEELEEEEDGALPPIQETDEIEEMSQSLSQARTGADESSQDSEYERDDKSSSQTQSQSQTRERDKHTQEEEDEDESGSSDGEEDSDVLMSAGEEENEDAVMVGGPKHIQCQEDEDFMAAFDKMMAENITNRTHESLKVPQMDIAVPLHIKGQQNKKGTVDENTNSINFVVMTKKGNKPQFANLNVPMTEQFASRYREREEAQRMEKERMKQVVLDMHERQEEEEHQEMIAGMNRAVGLPSNLNRERRVKYQHPKGAPDADLIFGSKKR